MKLACLRIWTSLLCLMLLIFINFMEMFQRQLMDRKLSGNITFQIRNQIHQPKFFTNSLLPQGTINTTVIQYNGMAYQTLKTHRYLSGQCRSQILPSCTTSPTITCRSSLSFRKGRMMQGVQRVITFDSNLGFLRFFWVVS